MLYRWRKETFPYLTQLSWPTSDLNFLPEYLQQKGLFAFLWMFFRLLNIWVRTFQTLFIVRRYITAGSHIWLFISFFLPFRTRVLFLDFLLRFAIWCFFFHRLDICFPPLELNYSFTEKFLRIEIKLHRFQEKWLNWKFWSFLSFLALKKLFECIKNIYNISEAF